MGVVDRMGRVAIDNWFFCGRTVEIGPIQKRFYRSGVHWILILGVPLHPDWQTGRIRNCGIGLTIHGP